MTKDCLADLVFFLGATLESVGIYEKVVLASLMEDETG